jgi:hypothetical protein
MISLQCPTCGRPIQVPAETAGQAAQCPHCQGQFTVAQGAPVPPVMANASDGMPPPPLQKQGMNPVTIVAIVVGTLVALMVGCALVIVICLIAITMIGQKANMTFQTVGSSLRGPGNPKDGPANKDWKDNRDK